MLRRSKSEGPGGQTRVLVVNRDADACELIARILEAAGWAAARATSDADALTQASTGQPAFTAMVIDESDTETAVDLLTTVRSRPELADLAVVVLAADPGGAPRVWGSGADGFLVRPFHADDLVNELYAVFTRSPQERDEHRRAQLTGA